VPFNVRLGAPVLPTTGTLVLKADVLVKDTPYSGVPVLPYIMVNANGIPYYILSGNRVTTTLTPYLTAGSGKNKYFRLYDDILDYEIASIGYDGLPPGRYPVLGAFLDSNGRLVGQLAERILIIE